MLTCGSRELSGDCLDRLVRYDWPGNVRELHYALTHADALAAPNSVLELCHFPEELTATGAITDRALRASDKGALKTVEQVVIDEVLAMEGGNVSRAAKRLGIGRATLYRRLKIASNDRG